MLKIILIIYFSYWCLINLILCYAQRNLLMNPYKLLSNPRPTLLLQQGGHKISPNLNMFNPISFMSNYFGYSCKKLLWVVCYICRLCV